MLAAFAARCIGLDRSFILDEFRTINFSSLPVRELLKAIRLDSYPPFSYLILSGWMNIAGGDIWIRLPFIIFGMLSVVTAYLIGKELMDSKCGLAAMFLMAIMPMQVWISQYARGISPSIFFTLVSTLFFLRLVKSDMGRRDILNIIGYAVSAIIAIYSFYFSFFIIMAQNVIYLGFNRDRPGRLLKWSLLQTAALIAFLPWAGGFQAQLKEANIINNFTTILNSGLSIGGWQIGTYMRAFLGFLGLDQALFVNTPLAKYIGNRMAAAAIISVLLIALSYLVWLLIKPPGGLEGARRAPGSKFSVRETVLIFSTFAVAPFALSVLLNLSFKTPLTPRYLATSSAFLIFVYAFKLYTIKTRPVMISILAVFIAISLWRLSDFTKTIIDYKNSSLFVKNNIQDNECLLFIVGDSAFEHYAGLPRHYIRSQDYIRRYKGVERSLKYLVNDEALKPRLEPFGAIWIYNSGEQMRGMVRYVLGLIENYGYKKVKAAAFKGLTVFKYAK